MRTAKYLLSDLDGVIRHFSAERDAEIERAAGLPAGSLHKTAFEKELLNKAVTGVISDEAWRAEVARTLGDICGGESASRAVREWTAFPGTIDHAYLEFVEKHFSMVAVLTNGTSRLNRDLATLGVEKRFHRIFNSAEIGHCKPSQEVYLHVIEKLKCRPDEILFVDDRVAHTAAARKLGMNVHHYVNLKGFQATL